jgi:hypothetical protein
MGTTKEEVERADGSVECGYFADTQHKFIQLVTS